MARYDPFEEMDRMFEQLRTRMWTPEDRSGLELPAEDRRGLGFPAEDRVGLELPAEGRTDFRRPAREGEGVTVDLTKHDEEYVLAADLPGFEREEIDLTFDDGVLALVAENETSTEQTAEEDEIAVRGTLTRSRRASERVTVPEAVREDEITASYRNGVLEVHLPLAEPEAARDDSTKIDIAD